jgi:hypothetical protein
VPVVEAAVAAVESPVAVVPVEDAVAVEIPVAEVPVVEAEVVAVENPVVEVVTLAEEVVAVEISVAEIAAVESPVAEVPVVETAVAAVESPVAEVPVVEAAVVAVENPVAEVPVEEEVVDPADEVIPVVEIVFVDSPVAEEEDAELDIPVPDFAAAAGAEDLAEDLGGDLEEIGDPEEIIASYAIEDETVRDILLTVLKSCSGEREEARRLVTEFITDNPERINEKYGNCGVTFLHIAAAAGDLVLVKFLLKNGADLHLKTDTGYTALYGAFCKNHRKVARYLVKRGLSCVKELVEDPSLVSRVVPFVSHCEGAVDTLKKAFEEMYRAIENTSREVDSNFVADLDSDDEASDSEPGEGAEEEEEEVLDQGAEEIPEDPAEGGEAKAQGVGGVIKRGKKLLEERIKQKRAVKWIGEALPRLKNLAERLRQSSDDDADGEREKGEADPSEVPAE